MIWLCVGYVVVGAMVCGACLYDRPKNSVPIWLFGLLILFWPLLGFMGAGAALAKWADTPPERKDGEK